MRFVYEKAKIKDFLEIAALDRISWKKNRRSKYIPDGEHVWRLWCEMAIVVCVRHNKKIVGSAIAFKSDDDRKMVIHKIFVHPKYQNKGIGSNLMRKILSVIKTNQKNIFLTVDPKNDKAISLYENFGFEKAQLIKGFYRKKEDRIIMILNPIV